MPDATALTDLAESLKPQSLKELASKSESRLLEAAGWTVDLRRHYLTAQATEALLSHGEACGLNTAREALFSGHIVNPSENRPALHWALRTQRAEGPAKDVYETVQAALALVRTIRQKGHYKAIVHIGIGGSDFGPRLLADAFADQQSPAIDLRFCANVDPLDLDLALSGLDPQSTLIIGISKSFGTEETLYNLGRARTWLEATLGAETAAKHLLLITANPARAKTWLDGADVVTLHLPESVGGRYSIWSAASVAIMLAFGTDVFEAFLQGAAEMDSHVQSARLEDNLAMRLALLDYWNTSLMGFSARAVLAYSRRLRMLPAYLQQLEMESNGKSVSPEGETLFEKTAPLLWGGEGSIGQHSYHQWLHQGTYSVPTEFILAPGARSDVAGVTALTAHALAQAEVLANGRSLAEVTAEEPDLPITIAAQKVHPGGHPSTFMFTESLTPTRLGALIALYEHRTYFAGILWGLNSFDQWGVERGKTMAGRITDALSGSVQAADPVTQHLIQSVQSV